MIFEYALQIMVITALINIRGDGFNIAGLFILVSIFFGWLIGIATYIESYILYACGELILIHLMSISNGPLNLIMDMIKLSILSIVVQLLGLLMWVEYYDSDLYVALCQVVFILQLIRLTAHGLATRKAFDNRSGDLDSLYTSDSGEKL